MMTKLEKAIFLRSKVVTHALMCLVTHFNGMNIRLFHKSVVLFSNAILRIAILAIYRFDAIFDTESELPEKCKHSFAQLEYFWQFCKMNVSKS